MYLKHALIENVGPVERLDLELPFRHGRPLPVVLVGPNGSGKTTLLSFVVNALVGFKQQVYTNAEVEAGRVFRVRSTQSIHVGATHSHARLDFDGDLWSDEWVLDRPRQQFEKEVYPLPPTDGWRQVQASNTNSFKTHPESPNPAFRDQPNEQLSRLFADNVVLYFPSDLFEPPQWLNERDLTGEYKFPAVDGMEGETSRRIFAKSLLKPTLEWLRGVAFDQLLGERSPSDIQLMNGQSALVLLPTDGPCTRITRACSGLLATALGHDGQPVQIQMSGRRMSRLSAVIGVGESPLTIPDLLGLSAGQSALFCLFANILRDFDLTGRPFESTEAVRGLVVIDEVDLHLHVGMQHDALPALVAKFPNVQFVITTHSPLLVMGMAKRFGPDGYQLLEMPSGRVISPEAYSEFTAAFHAFAETREFEARVVEQVRQTDKPVVLVEGKTDAAHLNTAWEKLNPGVEVPYLFVPCGGDAGGPGGAETLKKMLEALGWYEQRTVVGVFDNDRAGANQHNSLCKSGFAADAQQQVLVHRGGAIRAVVLPVPAGREPFAPAKLDRRVLEIEHYYPDATLTEYGLKGEGLYGSGVFEINSGAKTRFAERVIHTLPPDRFELFRPLFRLLSDLTRPGGQTAGQPERQPGEAQPLAASP